LREAADLLHSQKANPFRVGAYRRAADQIGTLGFDIRDLFERQGIDGLDGLPHVGKGIASSIAEMLVTGRWMQLERLRGVADPVELFQTIPGIGKEFAIRIHDTLHVDTLEALELAALEGRLNQVSGLGNRRIAAIRASLSSMLGRVRGHSIRWHAERADGPAVEALLAVDREYLAAAAQGKLPTIAPKRFNPAAKRWLPVLHTERDGWHFTAMYSNTARAHELGRTHDWVIIYFYDDSHLEGQRTVVTESRGNLSGKRVVRGKESECETFYKTHH
jgi:hypothetical protein